MSVKTLATPSIWPHPTLPLIKVVLVHTGFSITKCQMYFIDFGPFIWNKNHFFENSMHKTFAQFILDTFWCFLTHIKTSRALRKKIGDYQPKNSNFSTWKNWLYFNHSIKIIHFGYLKKKFYSKFFEKI